MLKALDAIVSFLKMIVGFVIMIINHIIDFITNIPTYLSFLQSLFGLLPTFLQWFVVAALFYGLIHLIISKVRGND